MISEGELQDIRERPGKPMGRVAELWTPVAGTNKIMCTACARYCKIGEGQVGLCGVRGVHEGKLWLYVYGRVITGHVDPIEKKPVTHYRPGSKIFSIATTGCNWLCHPAGTQILMADGDTKPVEAVRSGDVLWSVASLGGRPVPAIVTAIGSRSAASWRVHVEGLSEPLLATAEHPVLTPRGWVETTHLSPSDRVMVAASRQDLPDTGDRPLTVPRHGLEVHPAETARFWQALRSGLGPAPGFRWARITRVELEGPRERVFSFECVPFHNYLAGGVVVHNCRYCFVPGTMVLTDHGPQPIESLFGAGEPTDHSEVRRVRKTHVLTHRGRWRRVTKAFQHLYSGPVLRVRPYYLPGFECTPDHAVYASIGGRAVRKVEARHLKVGDFLAIPRLSKSSTSKFDVSALFADQRAPNYVRTHRLEISGDRIRWSSERGLGIPASLPLTPALGRLLGSYCAEGSVSWHRKRRNSGSVWFSFGAHEEKHMRTVERDLKSVFGATTRRTRQGDRIAVIASGATLARFFQALCGDSSSSKRVPPPVLASTDPRILRPFLAGYFAGDGYVTERKGGLVVGSSSVSAELTWGVARLLLTLGDVPRVYRARNPPTYVTEGRQVSRLDDHMLRLWVDEIALDDEAALWKASRVRVLETDDYLLIPIRSIEERQYVGPVYNLEVEEDHSYTANLLAVANCQNFDISQRRKVEGIEVEPHDVVRMTLEQGCQGIAYTYNQPTIFIEFARDIGLLARKAGLINIFVSNGYDTPETVAEMGKFLDCVTVDFKGSGETNFVRKYINIPNADPIFQTLLEIRDKTKIHTEITDLIVPQVGDDLDAARKLSKWVYDNLGPDTPIHFLRFHPDYKMMEFPWTPVETLEKHCAIAKEVGLRYVYVGNVPGHPLEHTYCPGCGAVAIKRYGFDITGWYLDKENRCKKCGYKLAIHGTLEKTARESRFYGVLYPR